MKSKLGNIRVGAAGLVLCITVIFFLYTGYRTAPAPTVIDAIYPLYAGGLTWSPKLAVTLPPKSSYNPTKQKIVGYQVSSLPTPSTNDISSVVEPLRNQYDYLLLKEGWYMDTNYEADGPGGSLWGFTKGNKVLIFSYTSTFLNQQPHTPEQCPCTVVFTIIGGELQ